MTDLQLGLLAIGVAAVVAVLVYNRLQEGRARRDVERAFGTRGGDALLGGEPGGSSPAARMLVRRHDAAIEGLPDPRIDYVADLEISRGTLAATVLENWRGMAHRFAGRALLAGSDGGPWMDVMPGDVRSLTALRAALQVVSRSGVVTEAELLAFRAAVDTLGAELGARVSAPEMREALDAARSLDKLCADADIQVALHVAGEGAGDEARLAEALGPEAPPFLVEARAGGASLVLDVPRAASPHAFEAMSRAARHLASASNGQVVDDNGNRLDERALAVISAEVDAVRARLAAAGIDPGSPLALRLFS